MKIPRRKKKPDTLEFEIEFFEKVLRNSPRFVQALIALGDAYTKSGNHEKGLEIDKQLAQLRPDDPVVFYNLACSYSLLKHIDLSFRACEQAIELGYADFDYMQRDADLENLRQDIRFQELLSRFKPSTNKPQGETAV